jgi:hypothetical protein
MTVAPRPTVHRLLAAVADRAERADAYLETAGAFPRGGHHVSPLRLGIRVDEHANRRCFGHELAQQFQSLRSHQTAQKAYARDIAARAIQARDEAVRYRIASCCKHNRDCCGRGFSNGCCDHVTDDDVDRTLNEFSRLLDQPALIVVSRAVFNRDVLAFDEACFLKTIAECLHEMGHVGNR